MRPPVAAYVVERMDLDHSAAMLEEMEPQAAASLVKQVKDEHSSDVLDGMDDAHAAAIIQNMAPDDAADVLAGMSEAHRAMVLRHLEPQAAGGLGQLLRYDSDCAGGIMTTRFVGLQATETVGQAIEQIRRQASRAEQVYYVYVVDEHNQLLGVVSMRDLILAESATQLQEVMKTEPLTVKIADDRELVISRIREYDLLAIPVVNEGGQLMGIVTVDDVVDAMDEEFSEDV